MSFSRCPPFFASCDVASDIRDPVGPVTLGLAIVAPDPTALAAMSVRESIFMMPIVISSRRSGGIRSSPARYITAARATSPASPLALDDGLADRAEPLTIDHDPWALIDDHRLRGSVRRRRERDAGHEPLRLR